MKGRVDVSALDVNISFKELLQKVNELGYSRFPIYDESFDNICGILFVKEILPHINEPDHYDWKKILKPPFYVPDTKRIDVLLEEFQEERNHMAIVVDEYGGKLGIVTMEDILEEIFGEIDDEHDKEEMTEQKISDLLYLFSGRLEIDYLNQKYKFNLPSSDSYETLAGLFINYFSSIPQKDEQITIDGFQLKVVAVEGTRIEKIELMKLDS
jgi:CBS domain containing-hemolysin-like protein